jgi:hypothetical protein
MTNLNLVTNPIDFSNQVLSDSPNSEIPKIYQPVIRYYLYYIWRGAFEARKRVVQKTINSDLGFLCMASYKGFIPAIHLIRLGYLGDVMILLRATVERIALLGYLENNPEQIEKYNRGKTLYKKANAWAKIEWEKDQTTKVWNKLYGQMSKVAHSNIEGTAGHIAADNNAIGKAFREFIKPKDSEEIDFYEAALIGLLFALRIADQIASKMFDDKEFVPVLEDKDCLKYLSLQDIKHSAEIFQKWVDEGKQLSRKN